MPAAAKEQIIAAVNAEIERLTGDPPSWQLPEGADIALGSAGKPPLAPSLLRVAALGARLMVLCRRCLRRQRSRPPSVLESQTGYF